MLQIENAALRRRKQCSRKKTRAFASYLRANDVNLEIVAKVVVHILIPKIRELAAATPFLHRPSHIRVKNTHFCVVFTPKRRQLRNVAKVVVRILIPEIRELAAGPPFLHRPIHLRVKNTHFCVAFTPKRRQLRKCCKSGRSQIDTHNMGISHRNAILAPTKPYPRKKRAFLRSIYAQTTST